MKRLLFSALVLLLGSCASVPTAPAGMAWIYPEALRGMAAATFRPRVVIREVDQRALRVEESNGLALRPGFHSVVVSMISEAGATVGEITAGRLGNAIGSLIDELHAANFEQSLGFLAEPGHTYRACVLDDGTGYRFWIEDQTSRRVVAGTKFL